MKTVSCGMIIRAPDGRVLAVHPTASRFLDLPKGGREDGETSWDAAVRELEEETGFTLSAKECESAVDLGEHPYNKAKRLHLFAVTAEVAWNLRGCRCRTTFPHPKTGEDVPENDGFYWKTDGEFLERAAPSMQRWLQEHETPCVTPGLG